MPHTNDNILLASGTQANKKKHSSIVELLSTPPLLPRSSLSGKNHSNSITSPNNNSINTQNNNSILVNNNSHSNNNIRNNLSTEDNELSKTTTNESLHSSISSISLNNLESVPMISSVSQGLHTVHTQNWQHTKLSQLIESNKLILIKKNITIENAFNTLIQYSLTSLPVEMNDTDKSDCLTFDYNDLNAYLLIVLNKIAIANTQLMKDCQNGKPAIVGDLIQSTPKDPFVKLSETENLSNAISILGSGVHRIAITNPQMDTIKGILSQRRLIKHLWDNARSFPDLEPLLNSSLQDLQIGVFNDNSTVKLTSKQSKVISIHGDEPLEMALFKMYQERISSIAVIDAQNMLIGNISVTDVKHVTRTSQYHLLSKTCRHFISIILNTRGLENGGKDSFPIFHVYPTSSLGRTIAKLVATKSHRLWIVKPSNENTLIQQNKDYLEAEFNNSHSAEKDRVTGKLIGVVSLTDILSVLARNQTEHKQVDPQYARRQRSNHI